MLNAKILNQANFSPAILGPFSFLVHKISGEGIFTIEVQKNGKTFRKGSIRASKDVEENQINLDMFAFGQREALPVFTLNAENGHILLYNSREFKENRVLIKKDDTLEFDSAKPGKEDLFGVNLLRPGKFVVSSKSMKKNFEIEVKTPELQEAKLSQTAATQLITEDILGKTNSIRILPNQGLVFKFGKGLSDIEIKLDKEAKLEGKHSFTNQLKADFRARVKVQLSKRKKGATIKKFSKKLNG
ncbi:hypothetical protein LAG90_16220 [Marinilongibacter aquaticus]|uniref:hypothetical protein n=1 Tax=Marinilongibacter aquaticus TaxID=2975157 RepID=UPI0021BD9528|nr:hypothetical protein [Marinilongibacter aquaticus]UBM58350.1 hypothetical protein LAG90_16220 [Marinilongibacter aquaticus]